jgi:hypothetical protein
MALGAFSMPTSATLDPPPLEPPDPLTVTVFLAATLGSGMGAATFLSPACAAPSPSPSEPHTCSAVALPEADALVSLGGDREPALGAGPDVTTFSFPLPDPKVESATLWPSVSSILGICTPQDTSLTCCTVTSMSFSVGISFSSFDLTA